MEFCERLRERRLAAGDTQRQVADFLGVDPTTYAHYESGRRFPKKEHLRVLCQRYEISFEENFPIVRTLRFPEKEIQELKGMMEPLQKKVNDWERTKRALPQEGVEDQKREFRHQVLWASAAPLRRLGEILAVLEKVWEEAMNAPEMELTGLVEHTEVMRVNFDPEEMRLYSEGLRLRLRILELSMDS